MRLALKVVLALAILAMIKPYLISPRTAPISYTDTDGVARNEGHQITMAQGQPNGPFVENLLKSLDFRGTGRDIYVVRADGRYDAVDASDLREPRGQIRDRVRSLLLNKLGLKERG